MIQDLLRGTEVGEFHSRSERIVDALTRLGDRVGNVLVYSSSHLVGIALLEVAIVMTILGVGPNPAPVVVGLVTFAVYTYDRLIDVDVDALSNPTRAAFVRRNRDKLYVLASMAYAVAVALAVLAGPLVVGLVLLPGMFGVLYTTNWIPDVGIGGERLKDVFLVNTLVVAVAWAVTLIFVPVAFEGTRLGPTGMFVFAYFLLRLIVDTELSNVDDIEADRSTGVSTLPVVLGVVRTRQALYVLNLATVGVVGLAVSQGYVGTGVAVALVVGVIYSLAVVSRVGRAADVERLSLASEFESAIVAGGLVVLLAV